MCSTTWSWLCWALVSELLVSQVSRTFVGRTRRAHVQHRRCSQCNNVERVERKVITWPSLRNARTCARAPSCVELPKMSLGVPQASSESIRPGGEHRRCCDHRGGSPAGAGPHSVLSKPFILYFHIGLDAALTLEASLSAWRFLASSVACKPSVGCCCFLCCSR